MHPAAGQVQVYIDDVALMLQGSEELRNLQLSKVLYLLAAFGVQVAMPKRERSKRVQWIGQRSDLGHAQENGGGGPANLAEPDRQRNGGYARVTVLPGQACVDRWDSA
jgi:hypothetical protein